MNDEVNDRPDVTVLRADLSGRNHRRLDWLAPSRFSLCLYEPI